MSRTDIEARIEDACGVRYWRDVVDYYATRDTAEAQVRRQLAASVVTAIETYAHYADAQNAERERRYAAQVGPRDTQGAQL
jgi:hypothetical protein